MSASTDEYTFDEMVTLYLGDATWHDGPGWYYIFAEYPEEGSCGAFATKEEAEAHARAAIGVGA